MPEREYKCGYSHCFHNGQKVKSSEAVKIGNKYYHWDCAATKQEIDDIRNIYLDEIDNTASFPILSRVLNDLVFKYDMDIDYIRFAVTYYAEYHIKIKSPFTLLYLRNNDFMKRKWEQSKRK